jgi:hypothetical protein
MAAPVQYQGQTISSQKIRMGKNAYVGAIDINGYTPAGKTWCKATGVFCVVRSVTGLTLAPIVESTAMGIGKNVKEITQGEQWEGYSFEVYGNAGGIFRWLSNSDPDQFSHAHEYQYPDRPLFLYEHVYDPESNTIASSRLIPYAIARQGEFAGLEPDGETFTTLEFYNRDSTSYPVRTLKPGYLWVSEIWTKKGSVVDPDTGAVNAAAPDGAILTFTLGTGNGSFSGATTPDAIIVDDTSTQFGKYGYVFLDGVDVTSQVTFNAATEVITFTTAPSATSVLIVIYAVIQSGNIPLVEGGINTTTKEEVFYAWETAGNDA